MGKQISRVDPDNYDFEEARRVAEFVYRNESTSHTVCEISGSIDIPQSKVSEAVSILYSDDAVAMMTGGRIIAVPESCNSSYRDTNQDEALRSSERPSDAPESLSLALDSKEG